jgi:hypothetical protein
MEDLRNSYIVNFCEVLVKKKGKELSPEELSKKVEDMYILFENMLGENMVAALPAEKQEEYMAQYKKEEVDFEKIGMFFKENISDPDEIMKKTITEFSTEFLKDKA